MFWAGEYPPIQWRSQLKNFGGSKMYDFRRITLFCLENRLSKQKMTIFQKFWGGMVPLPPGNAYAPVPASFFPSSAKTISPSPIGVTRRP